MSEHTSTQAAIPEAQPPAPEKKRAARYELEESEATHLRVIINSWNNTRLNLLEAKQQLESAEEHVKQCQAAVAAQEAAMHGTVAGIAANRGEKLADALNWAPAADGRAIMRKSPEVVGG